MIILIIKKTIKSVQHAVKTRKHKQDYVMEVGM